MFQKYFIKTNKKIFCFRRFFSTLRQIGNFLRQNNKYSYLSSYKNLQKYHNEDDNMMFKIGQTNLHKDIVMQKRILKDIQTVHKKFPENQYKKVVTYFDPLIQDQLGPYSPNLIAKSIRAFHRISKHPDVYITETYSPSLGECFFESHYMKFNLTKTLERNIKIVTQLHNDGTYRGIYYFSRDLLIYQDWYYWIYNLLKTRKKFILPQEAINKLSRKNLYE